MIEALSAKAGQGFFYGQSLSLLIRMDRKKD